MFGDLESSAITYSTKKNNTMKLEAICDVKKAQERLNYVPEFLSQQNCTTNGNHEKKLEKMSSQIAPIQGTHHQALEKTFSLTGNFY